jgi:hypothetical protein
MNFADPLYKVLVRKKGDVADLVTQSRQRQRLTRLLQNALDPALASHVWVARLEPPTLVLVVDTPARASRLRYLGPGLARKLSQKHKEFQSVSKIELRIAPARLQPRKPEPVVRQLGPKAVSSLTAMANSLEDTPLKTALLRLASRAKSNAGRSD